MPPTWSCSKIHEMRLRWNTCPDKCSPQLPGNWPLPTRMPSPEDLMPTWSWTSTEMHRTLFESETLSFQPETSQRPLPMFKKPRGSGPWFTWTPDLVQEGGRDGREEEDDFISQQQKDKQEEHHHHQLNCRPSSSDQVQDRTHTCGAQTRRSAVSLFQGGPPTGSSHPRQWSGWLGTLEGRGRALTQRADRFGTPDPHTIQTPQMP